MTLSGWARLWIVVAALPFAGCGNGEDAMIMANSAISHAQSLQHDMRGALDRIEDLEGEVQNLEDAKQELESRVDDLEAELRRVALQASNAEGAALSRR